MNRLRCRVEYQHDADRYTDRWQVRDGPCFAIEMFLSMIVEYRWRGFAHRARRAICLAETA